jgi:eukaryotic-like serine/threonine-protein kinase
MNRASAPAVARSSAMVFRDLFKMQSPLLGLGRYELVRTIGSGGMGIVYEAHDPVRRERVALKMLKAQGASELYWLKQEFRSSAELSHPNLVALFELSVAQEHAFFTMELVVGTDVVSFLRKRARHDLRSFREVLVQLCDGISAIHAAGKLHRDLKPSNVLVTGAGRVVLLDFGLVQDLLQEDAAVGGTPAYMAPEQARGRACQASDWFSFGKLLQQMIAATDAGEDASLLAVLPRLSQLAESLTAPEPAHRPSAEEILTTVRGARPKRRAHFSATPSFVGRRAELAALAHAFARSRRAPVFALLRGESGVGKTTLMRQFVEQTSERTSALVLSGRCYERESVPFKAFDSAIDALSRHLAALPNWSCESLSDSERHALRRVFPVIARASIFAADSCETADLHPVELRRRSFEALKKVLRELGDRQPVILCIDDIQWSDEDSGALLAALLCDENGPPLLIVASDRTDPGLLNPALEYLYRSSDTASRAADIVELTLLALSQEEALTLARVLLVHSGKGHGRLPACVALESHGNPLFLRELARRASADATAFAAPEDALPQSEAITFETLVAAGVHALSQEAKQVLDLVALAGRPLSLAVVRHALPSVADSYHILKELRTARLVHVARCAGDELVEIEHHRIGEVVRQRVDMQKRRALHAQLALALDAELGAGSHSSIAQYLEAGMSEEAAQRARSAGQLALSALAFSHAAALLAQALELGQWPDAMRASLYHDLALALENSGQGLDAAAAYQNAARHTKDGPNAALLNATAAGLLIHNGRYEEGRELVRHAYGAVGLVWPTGRLRLGISIASLLLRASVRPLRKDSKRRPTPLHLTRARLLSAAGACFEMNDGLRTAYNALLMLREAEDSPYPIWRTRAQGLRGLMQSVSMLPGGMTRGFREMEEACATALALGDLAAKADLSRLLVVVMYLNGQLRAALDMANRSEIELRALPLPPREMHQFMGILGCVLFDLGELREARERLGPVASQVRNHNDAFVGFWIHAHPIQLALRIASGDRVGTQAIVERQRQLSDQHPRFKSLQWAYAYCRAEAELYWGSAAYARELVERDWSCLIGVGYPIFDVWALNLRARAALGAAALLPVGSERARLLRCVSAMARSLRWKHNRSMTEPLVLLLLACRALLQERPHVARETLEAALVLLEGRGSKLTAASARYCLGLLQHGDEGRATRTAATEILQREGVRDPHEWSLWTLPGFATCEVTHDR